MDNLKSINQEIKNQNVNNNNNNSNDENWTKSNRLKTFEEQKDYLEEFLLKQINQRLFAQKKIQE